jgi:hypothetical protein
VSVFQGMKFPQFGKGPGRKIGTPRELRSGLRADRTPVGNRPRACWIAGREQHRQLVRG